MGEFSVIITKMPKKMGTLTCFTGSNYSH